VLSRGGDERIPLACSSSRKRVPQSTRQASDSAIRVPKNPGVLHRTLLEAGYGPRGTAVSDGDPYRSILPRAAAINPGSTAIG
jgi:hypothetical protein